MPTNSPAATPPPSQALACSRLVRVETLARAARLALERHDRPNARYFLEKLALHVPSLLQEVDA